MPDVAEIIKAVHDIFDNGDVTISVDARNLGMAYAIPAGLETTVVETYSPWTRAELRQVFYRQGDLGATMAEIQLIMSWRYSQAQQYIIEAYLDKNVISIDPTVGVKIQVRFNNPSLYNTDLEAYEIPFQVTIDFKPLLGSESVVFHGLIRADGGGEFKDS